jgi:hypothetical protein
MSRRSIQHARRVGVGALGVAAALGLLSTVANAAWTSTATGSSTAKSATLGTPAGGTATAASTTSINITWTPATAGTAQAQTTYFVTGGGTCNAAATASGCTVSGLTANTAYTFQITAKVQGWSSAASGSFGTSTNAPAGIAGIAFGSPKFNNNPLTLSCGAVTATRTCTGATTGSSGNTRNFTFNIVTVDASGNAFAQTSGSAVTVSFNAVNSGSAPGSTTIANNGSSTATVTYSLANGSSTGTLTASVTIATKTYTISAQVS